MSLISLISVDLIGDLSNPPGDANQLFSIVKGQDFVTYTSGEGPGVPAPAPVLLIGIGLLGLYRFSCKRA